MNLECSVMNRSLYEFDYENLFYFKSYYGHISLSFSSKCYLCDPKNGKLLPPNNTLNLFCFNRVLYTKLKWLCTYYASRNISNGFVGTISLTNFANSGCISNPSIYILFIRLMNS